MHSENHKAKLGFAIFIFILAFFCEGTSLKAQVNLQVTINSGSSGTVCTDGAFGGAPEPHWSVRIQNEAWITYPRAGICFTNPPNTQFNQDYFCSSTYPSVIEVCFRAFEDDGAACVVSADCLEQICQNFPTPFPGTSSTFSMTIPNNGTNTSWGTFNFTISSSGSFSSISGIDEITACDSFTWINGVTYNTSNNSATFTLPSAAANGCDSIVTLNLTINNSSTSTINEQICDGNILTIGGNSFSTSGNYTITIPNSQGCDSTINLSLNVIPAIGSSPAAGFFNTGSNGTGGVLPGGSNDLIWQVSRSTSGTINGPYAPAVVMSSTPASYFSSPWPDATWISHVANGSHTVNEDFFYRAQFDLACADLCGGSYTDPNTFCLNLDFYADNSVFEIYINGVPQSPNIAQIPVPNPYFSGGFLNGNQVSVSLCNNWQPGNNEIIIHITSSPGFAGFLAQTSTNPPPVPTDTITTTICDGQTFVFNGNDLSTAGTYTENFVTALGCDSLVTLVLSVDNITNGFDVQTACNSFTWIDGNTYTTSTNTPNFTIVGGNANGCDSIVTLNLTITPSQYITITNDSPTCDPNQLSWITWSSIQNGSAVGSTSGNIGIEVTHSAGGFFQTAGMFSGNLFPSQYNVPINSPALASQNAGTFTFCFDTPINNPQVAFSSIGSPGVSVPIVTSVPYQIIWEGVDVTYIDNLNFIGEEGYNIIVFPGTHTCITLEYLAPEFYYNIAFGIQDENCQVLPLCEGESVTLVARGGANYFWSPATSLNTTIGSTVIATPSSTITYTVVDSGICNSTATIEVTVLSIPQGIDVQTACDTFTWIDGITYTTSNNTATFTLPGAAANGCDSIVILNLTINNTQTSTDVQTACDSFTWIDGITYTASNNAATFTLPGAAANGCDSIVTLSLTINTTQNGIDVRTACNSFTWIDGITYTASNNNATFTLPGAATNGCDSIVTLNLTINTTQNGVDVRTACNSFTWIDGITYTASNNAATFTLPGAAANGCDSIVTLNLTINNTQTGTDVQTACDSFTWIDGITYTTSNNSATFTLQGAATNGCDSIVTLNLTINTTQTGIDVQTACDTFTWIDGITYTASNNSATLTLPGAAANGCDSIVTLNLTINTTQNGVDVRTACNSFTWIDGITYTASNNAATFTLPGAAANGCDSIVTLNLTINTTQNGIDVRTACNSFTWIDGITYTASNNNATFTLPGAAANGCDSIVTLNLTINTTQNGIDVRTACNSFTWIDGITYTASNNNATFTLPGAAENGCDSIVTLNLTINTTQNGVDVRTACNSFTWIDGITYTVSNNAATFILPGTAANGCDSIVTLNLTIIPLTTPTFTPVSDICRGTSFTLPSQSLEGITGSWSPALNNQVSTTYTFTPSANECATTTLLTVNVLRVDTSFEFQSSCFLADTGAVPNQFFNEFGCDSIHIVITELVVNNYTVNPDFATVLGGESFDFTINNEDENLEFSWFGTNGESCNPPCDVFTVNPNDFRVLYFFTLTDLSNGCITLDTLRIDVEFTSELNIPNIFTPNGDGQNDVYRVYGKDIFEFSMMIFDRWGGKVFETTNLNNGWDGNLKGQPVQSGVYIAIIEATGLDARKYKETVNVKLVR